MNVKSIRNAKSLSQVLSFKFLHFSVGRQENLLLQAINHEIGAEIYLFLAFLHRYVVIIQVALH